MTRGGKKPGDPKAAKQVVLCTGKVYYDLLEECERRGITDIHFLRLEQLYPFPADALAAELAPYKHCDLVWCQEEPRNMGAWTYLRATFECDLFGRWPLACISRPESASPATGSAAAHKKEQAELIAAALG